HEARRMSTLVDDMLRLARLDQQPRQHLEPVDVTALVTECAERAGITDQARTWHTDIAPGLAATGDEELLRRALDNLLANVPAPRRPPPRPRAPAVPPSRPATAARASRRPSSPASSPAFTAAARAGAPRPEPASGSPSSARSPPLTTAPRRPASTTRTGCASRSPCPADTSPAPRIRSAGAAFPRHAQQRLRAHAHRAPGVGQHRCGQPGAPRRDVALRVQADPLPGGFPEQVDREFGVDEQPAAQVQFPGDAVAAVGHR